jgi:ABC-2 type transport system permease protein
MRQAWRIARRELRGYFDQPTAYILLTVFLLLAIWVAFRTLYGSGVASLRTAFSLLPWLFAIFVPAMTMRAVAEERRSGTLEWLAAQPVTEPDLLLGKYLGSLLFVLTTLVGTLPTAIGLLVFSDADAGALVAQYAGAVLLAAQMTAIGIWSSSATRNQITAFILGLAVAWTLVFAGESIVLETLPAGAADLVASLAVLTRFDGIARGVLDLRDVLYFVTTALLFLSLAWLHLARLRLSPTGAAHRRLQAGVIAIAVGVVVINALGRQLRGRLDLTRGDLYTLADETVDALRSIDDPVTIKLYASRGLPPEVRRTMRDVRDLLLDVRSASRGRVRFEEHDPDGNADVQREAAGYGLRQIQFSVLRGDELQVKRGWFGMVVVHLDRHRSVPLVQRTDDLEYRLVSTLGSLADTSRRRVAFLTGFEARTPFSYNAWREMLDTRHALTSIYADSGRSPTISRDSIDVLVIAGPRRPIDSAVVRRIGEYLEAGGPALLLLDGTNVGVSMTAEPIETGLEPLLARYGVRLGRGLVYDLKSAERTSVGDEEGIPYLLPFPLWPRPEPAQVHPTTTGLSALTLAWATPLELSDTLRTRPLWVSTDAAGRFLADGIPVSPRYPFRPDTTGLHRHVVAAAITADSAASGARGRIVVVGDADFLEDRYARPNPQNLIFAGNAVDWLLQDESVIRIRSKDRTPPPLVFETRRQADLFKWANLAGVPLLVVALGALRITRRRRGSSAPQ